MAKTKTPRFKADGYSLNETRSFCNCCGAQFKCVTPWDLEYFPGAGGAAGKGIILSDTPPTQALADNEKITTVNSRNGTFYFTTRH